MTEWHENWSGVDTAGSGVTNCRVMLTS